jgi:FMN phosphatase YigB (HAD superfamily)
MNYSHIFFDWHGVLSKSIYFSHIPEFQVIEKQWLTAHKALLKKWGEGKCDVDEFINELSDSTHLSKAYLTQTLKESCEAQIFVSDKIPSLIRSLRKEGIVCVIATDNYDVFDKWIVPSLGLDSLFDDILNSYNLKALKPELGTNNFSPFFSKYLKDHNVNRSLWLDDNDMSYQAKILGIDFKLVKPEDDLVSLVVDLIA